MSGWLVYLGILEEYIYCVNLWCNVVGDKFYVLFIYLDYFDDFKVFC